MSDPPGIDPALEAEYSLRPRHPEREAVYAAMRAEGVPLRAHHAATQDLRYGPGPRMRLDYFGAQPGAPLLVFIHGGYWRALDKETFAFLSVPLLAAGISVALPGYDLAPATPVGAIGAQVTEAAAWLAAHAGALGFDPGRVVLSGHSAGAQLAALLALGGGCPLGLRGLLGVSGVYDLEPLLQTSIGGALCLTVAEARSCSPLRLASRHRGLPIRLAVGADETNGFLGQTETFAAALRLHGRAVAVSLVSGTNHFTVLRRLFEPPVLAVLHDWFAT